jgi:hypothetical protein
MTFAGAKIADQIREVMARLIVRIEGQEPIGERHKDIDSKRKAVEQLSSREPASLRMILLIL